ncbi:unnamed protein product, partial [Discosporangium mesarthrocarpum]
GGGGEELEQEEKERDEKKACTVFVGNLPISTGPKKVTRLFREFGKVASVRIRSVAVEGAPVDDAGNQVRQS